MLILIYHISSYLKKKKNRTNIFIIKLLDLKKWPLETSRLVAEELASS